ncbi:class I SAM-dependent methyltransferase [Candidatus Pacearchaeota archaeon]|nr:class I SAM-dependent methyltransferase [Candidatus Pacearchaeota archaeon]
MNQQSLWDTFYTIQAWQKETLDLPQICANKRILELGCGNGKTLKAILSQDPQAVLAIDFSGEALKRAKEMIQDLRVTFLHTNVLALPGDLGTFDVIVCYYLLNNLTPAEQTSLIASLHSLLNPEGTLLLEDYTTGDHREQTTHTLRRDFISQERIKQLLANYTLTSCAENSFSPYKQSLQQRRIIRASAIHPVSSKKYDNSG